MAMGVRAASLLEKEGAYLRSSRPATVATETPAHPGDTALRGGSPAKKSKDTLINSETEDLMKIRQLLHKEKRPTDQPKASDVINIDDARELKVEDFTKYSSKAYASEGQKRLASATNFEQKCNDLKESLKEPGITWQERRKNLEDDLDAANKEKKILTPELRDFQELQKLEKLVPEIKKQAIMFEHLAQVRQSKWQKTWSKITFGGEKGFIYLNAAMLLISIPSMWPMIKSMMPSHSSKSDDSSQSDNPPDLRPRSIVDHAAQQQWQAQAQAQLPPFQGSPYPSGPVYAPSQAYAPGPPQGSQPLQSAFMSGTQPPPPPGYYGPNPYGMGG